MKNDGIEWKNGLLITFFIGIYFLIVEALNISDILWLRMLNLLIVAYGVNLTIKHKMLKGNLSYVSNLASGFITALIGVVLSIAGLFIYVVFITGTDYLQELAQSIFLTSSEVVLWKYAFGLFLEGISSSVVVSFAIMQRWKNVTSVSDANHAFFQIEQ